MVRRPGRAPTIVPKMQPQTAKKRVEGPSATLKPRARLLSKSINNYPINHLGKAERPKPKPNLKIIKRPTDKQIPVIIDNLISGFI